MRTSLVLTGTVLAALVASPTLPAVATSSTAGVVRADTPETAEVATLTGVRQVGRTTYPDAARVLVGVIPADGGSAQPPGEVVVRSGSKVIARGELTGGRTTLTLPARRPGTQKVTATYVPAAPAGDEPAYAASTSKAASVVTRKAASKLLVRAVRLDTSLVQATLTIYSQRAGTPTGAVRLLLDGRVVKRFTVRAADRGVRRVELTVPRGTHRLQATYAGNAVFLAGRSATRSVSGGSR